MSELTAYNYVTEKWEWTTEEEFKSADKYKNRNNIGSKHKCFSCNLLKEEVIDLQNRLEKIEELLTS
jgi:hypothetical protein